MSLVERAWQTTVPIETVNAERWAIVPMADGRYLVKDRTEGVSHTERTLHDAHVFVAANQQSTREKRSRAVAAETPIPTYAAARLVVRGLNAAGALS